jgi:hypothetical protein
MAYANSEGGFLCPNIVDTLDSLYGMIGHHNHRRVSITVLDVSQR